MSLTIDELFYGAYRDAGLILLEGTGIDQDQTEEARRVFNRLVDSDRNQGLKAWRVSRVPFDIVSGQDSYQIGPSGDWPRTNAPVRIGRASLIVTNTTPTPEYEMEQLTEQQYQLWRLKGLSTSWPSAYYYERPMFDGSQTQLNGTVHLLFVPSETNQVVLYIEESISPLSATGDALLEFPEGYQTYYETNMAKTLAARNPRSKISQLTLDEARRSARMIKIQNFRSVSMDSDYPTRGPALHDGLATRRW